MPITRRPMNQIDLPIFTLCLLPTRETIKGGVDLGAAIIIRPPTATERRDYPEVNTIVVFDGGFPHHDLRIGGLRNGRKLT